MRLRVGARNDKLALTRTDGAARGEAKLAWTIPSRDRGTDDKSNAIEACFKMAKMRRHLQNSGKVFIFAENEALAQLV